MNNENKCLARFQRADWGIAWPGVTPFGLTPGCTLIALSGLSLYVHNNQSDRSCRGYHTRSRKKRPDGVLPNLVFEENTGTEANEYYFALLWSVVTRPSRLGFAA